LLLCASNLRYIELHSTAYSSYSDDVSVTMSCLVIISHYRENQ